LTYYEVIERIQDNAEKAGYACMDFVLVLIRAVVALVKKLNAKRKSGGGEGYLRGFPEK
jgi:hypothetical protein